MDESGSGAVHTVVTAVTDCQVLIVPADAAAEAIGRTPAVAAAVQQISASRRRRIERLAQIVDQSATDGRARTTSPARER